MENHHSPAKTQGIYFMASLIKFSASKKENEFEWIGQHETLMMTFAVDYHHHPSVEEPKIKHGPRECRDPTAF